MLSTGSSNSGLINRDNSTIGVGNKADGIARSIACSIANSGRSSAIDTTIDTAIGSQVLSTGSSNSRLISRGHSTIGVSNQGGDVKGTRVAVGNRRSHSGDTSSIGNGSNSRGSSCIGNRGSQIVSISLSGKVLSTGSNHGRLISRGDGTVGVSDQAGDVERARVAIGDRGSHGNGGSISIIGSLNTNSGSSSIGQGSLQGEVLSTGSSHSGLIYGNHSTVGIGGEAIEGGLSIVASINTSTIQSRAGRGSRQTGGKDLVIRNIFFHHYLFG